MKVTINGITSDLKEVKFDWCKNIDDERSFVDQLYSELLNVTCGNVGLNNHAVEHKCMLLMFVRFLRHCKIYDISYLQVCLCEKAPKLRKLISEVAKKENDKMLLEMDKIIFDSSWTYIHNQDFLKAMLFYAGLSLDAKYIKSINQLFPQPTQTILSEIQTTALADSNRTMKTEMDTDICFDSNKVTKHQRKTKMPKGREAMLFVHEKNKITDKRQGVILFFDEED